MLSCNCFVLCFSVIVKICDEFNSNNDNQQFYLQFSQLANRMRSIPVQNRNNEIQICSSLVYLTNTTYIPSYPYKK